MTVEISIPNDLWDEDKEAVLANWLFDDGARVEEGALIAEVMMEKTQFEIRAPASGTLRIKVTKDDIVARGTVIGSLE